MDEYVQLFVDFKLKVAEAEAQQLDTLASFKNELKGYRAQQAQEYLVDTAWIEDQAIAAIYDIWEPKRKQELYHTLKEWYDKQSKRSKQGLYDGRTTNFMSCLEMLDVYSNQDVASKVVKAVTDVYIENWNTGSLEEFTEALAIVKSDIESIRDEASIGELELTFTGRNGETISKLYSHADEGTGSVLRNIIEDTLEEYDDLSVNDRVSILLEMIENINK